MIRDARAGKWTETALFATASVLLAQMGLGVFLFLIPLQVLFARRGELSLLAAGAAVFASITLIRVIGAATRQSLAQGSGILLVELVGIGGLVGGLVVVDAFERRPLPFLGARIRAVPRLLLATAAVAALCVPVALLLRARVDLGDAVQGVFREAAASIASVVSQGARGIGGETGIDANMLATRMYQVAVEVFPRTFLLYCFVILTFSWWAGNRSMARVTRANPTRLVTFRLGERYVWPLIVSLALVLADVAFGIGPAGYVGWNAGLIMLFLYGLQGLAILQFFFARYGVSRTLRLLAYVVLVVLFVSPGANAVLIIGLPALGVSETWLKYRTRRRSKDADEGNP